MPAGVRAVRPARITGFSALTSSAAASLSAPVSPCGGWGGVTLAYRKRMVDSPAYRLNHEEIIKALEEGITFAETLDPVEAVPDEFGAVRAMAFTRRGADGAAERNDTYWVAAGEGTQPLHLFRRHPRHARRLAGGVPDRACLDVGGPGEDLLYGEQGEDVFSGGPGADTLFGGPDFDTDLDCDPLDGPIVSVEDDDCGGGEHQPQHCTADAFVHGVDGAGQDEAIFKLASDIQEAGIEELAESALPCAGRSSGPPQLEELRRVSSVTIVSDRSGVGVKNGVDIGKNGFLQSPRCRDR